MEFEIINPSDEAYLEADDYETAVLTTIMIGESYAIKQVDGDFEMPIPFFMNMIGEHGFEEWYKEQFGKDFKKAVEQMDKEKIKKCLQSVHLARERSSLNDFTKYAHSLAKKLKTKKG